MVAGSRAKQAAMREAMARGPTDTAARRPVFLKPPKYTISDAFRILCKRTNGHGWFRIHRARSLGGTCCWFALTLIAFTFSVIYTLSLWTRFVRHTTETSIGTTIGKNPFPAVTICSLNPIKESLIMDMSVDIPFNYRQALYNTSFKVSKTLSEPVYKATKLKRLDGNKFGEVDIHYEAHQNLRNARAFATPAHRQLLGYRIDELISYCTFGGVPCLPSDWSWFLDEAYGNCYTWKRKTTVAAGLGTGLHVILVSDAADYLSWYAESVGSRVTIHEADSKPMPMADGFSVAPGKAVQFGVRLETWTRLGEPYNERGCGDYGEFQSTFGWKYTGKACRETCPQQHMVKSCGCADGREPPAKATPTCTEDSRDTVACMVEAKASYEDNPDGNCHCPPPCEEQNWRTLSGLATWPPPGYNTAMFKTKKTASVRVYYRTPSATHFKDIPSETTKQFLGWLGGQLSIWTGASLITLLEVLGFCVAALLVLCTENVDWLMADEDNNENGAEEDEEDANERLRNEMESQVVPRSHFQNDPIPEEPADLYESAHIGPVPAAANPSADL